MLMLKRASLTQFYLHEAMDIDIAGSIAFLGPNGSGKSSTLDAIQIAMLGGNQTYARFNTQSVSSKARRKISGYCLGLLRNPDKDSEIVGRARDEARTYIILVFSNAEGSEVLSAGICVEADIDSDKHDTKGLFILPGQSLTTKDCIVYEGDEARPIEFADFRHNCRERAKDVGRTAIFTDKSTEYVSELLYALNGQRMPDAKRFMSSFVKSMTLKNVDSIDQFVRDYVVEPSPVDIATFRKQVDQFVELRELVVRTKARISRLEGLLSDFNKARQAEQRIASLSVVREVLNVEWLGEQIDDLFEKIQRLEEQQKEARSRGEAIARNRFHKQEEVTGLRVQLETDKDEQIRLRLEEQIESNERIVQAYQQPEIGRANRLINAAREFTDDGEFGVVKKELRTVIDQLVAAREEDNAGEAIILALDKIGSTITPITKATSVPVSYTHLTLPTKRIV